MTDNAAHIHRLERRLEALRLWGERVSSEGGLRNLFLSFLPNLSETMEAERSTLFLYDEDAHQPRTFGSYTRKPARLSRPERNDLLLAFESSSPQVSRSHLGGSAIECVRER